MILFTGLKFVVYRFQLLDNPPGRAPSPDVLPKQNATALIRIGSNAFAFDLPRKRCWQCQNTHSNSLRCGHSDLKVAISLSLPEIFREVFRRRITEHGDDD